MRLTMWSESIKEAHSQPRRVVRPSNLISIKYSENLLSALEGQLGTVTSRFPIHLRLDRKAVARVNSVKRRSLYD